MFKITYKGKTDFEVVEVVAHPCGDGKVELDVKGPGGRIGKKVVAQETDHLLYFNKPEEAIAFQTRLVKEHLDELKHRLSSAEDRLWEIRKSSERAAALLKELEAGPALTETFGLE